MPLKENNTENKKKEENLNRVSEALSTDEIISLLSKSNKDFIKESEISSNITNLFKKVTLNTMAKKSENSQEASNIKEKDNKLNDQENLNKKETEKSHEEELIEPKKKYTEEEAKKMANELARKYYDNGYKMGVKKTTEELQNGEKSLAVTLKRVTDNLFEIVPEFHGSLIKSINSLIFKLCKDVIGYEIENKTEFFTKKIEKLVNSIEESTRNIEVILSPEDYLAIKNYNEKNNVKFSFGISEDKNLERGDLKIKSPSIEISEKVSSKIKLSSTEQLNLNKENLKENKKI
tara:strand:+ start:54 stop:926 length:873 start_codon:yes stop_codon:yes gene_type:complete